MPLSDQQIARLTEKAEASGVSVDATLRSAEILIDSESKVPDTSSSDDIDGFPTLAAERFLVGFLPYVTVREFRTLVLGIQAHVADEELFTGEWLALHGSVVSVAEEIVE